MEVLMAWHLSTNEADIAAASECCLTSDATGEDTIVQKRASQDWRRLFAVARPDPDAGCTT